MFYPGMAQVFSAFVKLKKDPLIDQYATGRVKLWHEAEMQWPRSVAETGQ